MRDDDFPQYYEKIRLGLPSLISAGFKLLLENRHLYQKAEIGVKELMMGATILSKTAGPPGTAARDNAFAQKCLDVLSWQWRIESSSATPISKLRGPEHLQITLPTIKTFCPNPTCSRIEPFNPRPDAHATMNHLANGKVQQIFVLEYECQSCKGLPTVFMIRRDGMKLFLEGRSPIEHVEVAKVIPKTQRKYISDAIVAHNSGQTLAGLFFLRTFIEQYARELSTNPSLPPDELIENYMKPLPDDFKSRFPSLGKIYSDLSGAIHNADASVELFNKTITDLNEHFEAKKMYKIVDKKPNPAPEEKS